MNERFRRPLPLYARSSLLRSSSAPLPTDYASEKGIQGTWEGPWGAWRGASARVMASALRSGECAGAAPTAPACTFGGTMPLPTGSFLLHLVTAPACNPPVCQRRRRPRMLTPPSFTNSGQHWPCACRGATPLSWATAVAVALALVLPCGSRAITAGAPSLSPAKRGESSWPVSGPRRPLTCHPR